MHRVAKMRIQHHCNVLESIHSYKIHIIFIKFTDQRVSYG